MSFGTRFMIGDVVCVRYRFHGEPEMLAVVDSLGDWRGGGAYVGLVGYPYRFLRASMPRWRGTAYEGMLMLVHRP